MAGEATSGTAVAELSGKAAADLSRKAAAELSWKAAADLSGKAAAELGGGDTWSGANEEWVLTGEVYWNDKGTVNVDKLDGQKKKKIAMSCDCNCSSLVRSLAAENFRLEKFGAEKDAKLQKVHLEKKMMARAHKAYVRGRERKEIGFVILGVACMMIYVVFALMTRGFV